MDASGGLGKVEDEGERWRVGQDQYWLVFQATEMPLTLNLT